MQGLESAEPSQQSLVGVLETAMRLANHDEGSDDEEEETPKKVQGVRAEMGRDNGERPGKPGQSRSDKPHAIGLPPLGCRALAQLCCSLGLSPFI
jgi:hypothetical protein